MPDRPIVDRTDLTGNFDLDISWADESRRAKGRTPAGCVVRAHNRFSGTSRSKAQSARGPVQFLVIDYVEKATSNYPGQNSSEVKPQAKFNDAAARIIRV